MTARLLACSWIAVVALSGGVRALRAEEPAAPLGAAAREPGAPEQTPEDERDRASKPYGWHRIGDDFRFLVARPTHPCREDRRKLWGVAGGTVVLYALRDEIREIVQDDRTQGKDDFLGRVRVMGDGAFAPGLALALYAASFATGNDREKETAFLLLESMGASTLGAGVGSLILAAERPEDGDSIEIFDVDGHGVSLDVSLAASVILPLRRTYLSRRPEDGRALRFWKGTATGALYTGAVLTALQRMYADKHWAPDVFLGMVNGLGMGRLLCEAHDRALGGAARLSVAPSPGGLMLRWTIPLGRAAPARRRASDLPRASGTDASTRTRISLRARRSP